MKKARGKHASERSGRAAHEDPEAERMQGTEAKARQDKNKLIHRPRATDTGSTGRPHEPFLSGEMP